MNDNKKNRLRTLLIIIVLIGIWLFFRKPVWFGEMDATTLIKTDKANSKNVMESMTYEMRKSINENILMKTGASVLCLQNDDDYYGISVEGGAIFPIDENGYAHDDLFRLNRFVCGFTLNKDGKLHFISGQKECRHPKGIFLFIDSSAGIWVLTDIQYWEYDFEKNSVKQIEKQEY